MDSPLADTPQTESPQMGCGAGPLMPAAIGGDISALLHVAADNSHIGIMELLFGKDASIQVTDQANNTLLHCAARDGYTDTVKLLLEKGAPIAAMNINNNTPLHFAAQCGHTGLVQLLLENGASIEASLAGRTPLHCAAAAWCGNTGMADLLLRKGASIEARSQSNRTPLDMAAERGHTDIVQLLENKAAELAHGRPAKHVLAAPPPDRGRLAAPSPDRARSGKPTWRSRS